MWLILFIFLSTQAVQAEKIFFDDNLTTSIQLIPLTVTVRSINDLRVKEGQKIRIGQLLALKPVEPQSPPRYIPKNHEYEVQKQKAKLERIRKIVIEEDLPLLVVKHEEAKLKDLEFAASEHRKGAIDPKTPQETVYKSPVNGAIKRITPLSGSDGRISVELLVQID